MKYIVAIVFAALAIAFVSAEETKASVSSAGSPTKFTTKFDDVNLDEILKSERLLKNYFDCLMDTKPCTPDGTELKKSLPVALKEECAGCSEKQRVGAETVIHYISNNKPELWKALEDKYDPEQVYRTKHADFAAKKGIKV
ncbi:ejaculatory bulb-specific protein 3 precursor, putative [Pediculus humanus corporis]|uniref:Ejaculatory bulb-specific protein 3, putative n=1 Tax=Pediculus humanus subsp. corporis TaxID=121224 RepID=E0W2K1_PEDHC|nr:ejaculatory bulb-specific protein 3 precursor, putative [Pediculus humanus corporis]EEB19857.1 ejaculatory bulb-specific protein 3 precursor, putative [Pediculus humanus corporis]